MMIVFRVILDGGMNTSVVSRKWEKSSPHGGMKTSVTRKQEETSPHRGYEDISNEKSGGEKSSLGL